MLFGGLAVVGESVLRERKRAIVALAVVYIVSLTSELLGTIYRCINNATYMSFIRSQITLHLFGILLDAAKR